MEIVAMLHDTLVERVRPGMPARVRVEGSREVTVAGHVELVEALPRRTFNDVPYYACRITLDLAPPGLLPGMSAEVEILAGHRQDVLAVPSEAVVVDQGRIVCYVIGPSGPERREVKTGGIAPNTIEVTDGLNEGEMVDCFERGLELQGRVGRAAVLYFLAMSYHRAGDPVKGRAALDRAVDLHGRLELRPPSMAMFNAYRAEAEHTLAK
jgi:hypothetical protein